MAELTDSRKRALLRQAAAWWDGKGRHLVRRQFNEERHDRRQIGGDRAPSIICRGRPTPVVPCGILMGRPWEALKTRERARVLEVYMHEFTELQSPRLTNRETLGVPGREAH